MALEIKWTPTAEKSFDNIFDYISGQFGENRAIEFLIKTFGILDYISEFPEMGTDEYGERGIKGFVVSKQNSVFYRVEGSNLVILNLYDNRRNPETRGDFY